MVLLSSSIFEGSLRYSLQSFTHRLLQTHICNVFASENVREQEGRGSLGLPTFYREEVMSVQKLNDVSKILQDDAEPGVKLQSLYFGSVFFFSVIQQIEKKMFF